MVKPFQLLAQRLLISSVSVFSFASLVQAQPYVSTVVPSGQVTQTDFVRLSFSEAVVRLGEGTATNPFTVECNGQAVAGAAKWSDDRTWQYDFAQTIRTPQDCLIRPNEGFTDLSGKPLDSSREYKFTTGVLAARATPSSESTGIHEDQRFILRFNGEVSDVQLQQHGYCAVEGIEERLPLRIVDAKEVPAYLETTWADSRYDQAKVVHCGRRLTPEATVSVVLEAGLTSQSGHQLGRSQRFEYSVREPFKGLISCQRLREGAPCMPLSDIRIVFNSIVDSKQLEQLRLEVNGQSIAPSIIGADNNREYNATDRVVFKGPFPEQAQLRLVLPQSLRDDLERELVNRGSLSEVFTLDEAPPLTKFAKQEFGIYEFFGEGDEAVAVIPITQRRLSEAQATPSYLESLRTTNDADVVRWLKRFSRLDEGRVDAVALKSIMTDANTVRWGDWDAEEIDTRSLSIFDAGQKDRQRQALPPITEAAKGELEVIGVPFKRSGFYVLELQSAALGDALLAEGGLMHVRTTALVTNLAVHLKHSPEDFLVWVTRLDTAEPVAEAQVTISNCKGEALHKGVTDSQGRLYLSQPLKRTEGCSYSEFGEYFISATVDATHPASQGVPQYSFALSKWNDGIEPWRFNVNQLYSYASEGNRLVEHSFFDRPLYQKGEKVAIRHYLRVLDKFGLALPRASELPTTVRIVHQGSGDHYDLPVQWLPTPSGGLSATSEWIIPNAAKLGRYRLSYLRQGKEVLESEQSIRVEAFKMPFLSGSMQVTAGSQQLTPAATLQSQPVTKVIVAPQTLDLDMQLNYISGGPASDWATEVSAMLNEATIQFADYEDYYFASTLAQEGEIVEEGSQGLQVFLKQHAMLLDAEGRGHLEINTLPVIKEASEVRIETSFLDPNGELQTLQQKAQLWPADLAVGMKLEHFDEGDVSAQLDLLVVNAAGAPVANQAVHVNALQSHYYVVRKRLVGGFYSYDTTERKESLGVVCEGKTNNAGKLSCQVEQPFTGHVIFQAVTADEAGRLVSNSDSAYYSAWGWMGSADHDRVDIVPDKKSYVVGEEATLQVRLPFQQATALVAIERSGMLESQVLELSAKDPTIRLKVEESWYPNVYVSVLALRGRIDDETMPSGANSPRVTGLIDLNKPSFRFGIGELKVTNPAKEFKLNLSLDKDVYQLRETATAKIKGVLSDGSPASRATVAIAVVDEALLELAEAESAHIIKAMRHEGAYGVVTATAVSEVVGRRHYGRKAVPAGGAAGDLAKRSSTRELFDSLLLWEPAVELDANGEAQVPITLNDSISRFRVIAVGDYGMDRFAEAQTDFVSTKDLQIIAGIPAVVREGDQYQLGLTLRNTTNKDLKLEVGGRSEGVLAIDLPTQEIRLGAKQSTTVSWPVTVVHDKAKIDRAQELRWHFEAQEKKSFFSRQGLADSISVSQVVQPLVPVTVRQSALVALEGGAANTRLNFGLPSSALSIDGQLLGGVQIQLQSSLLNQGDDLKQWFESYPYTCYEQLAAIAVGLDDKAAWDKLMLDMPQYMDAHGLVKYFPSERGRGSANLTAHLLSLSKHAKRIGLDFEIPTAHKERMLKALMAVFEGRIELSQRGQWQRSERLAALTALVEYGQVSAMTARSYFDQYEQWQMSDWVNWLTIANRFNHSTVTSIRAAARANLLALLSREGQLLLPQDSERTHTWWTMFSREANLAKLVFMVTEDEAWADELPYMISGLVSMQRKGHWGTTVANSYAKLALTRYAQVYESMPPVGKFVGNLWSASTVSSPSVELVTQVNEKSFADDGIIYLETMPWPSTGDSHLDLGYAGEGQLWATVSARAAVPVEQPNYAGYHLERKVVPVVQQVAGEWTQGDVYRVELKLQANAPMTWVVVNDPIPSGATILGTGLGRDSAILQAQSAAASTQDDAESAWWSYDPTFIERGHESYKAYYDYLGRGETVLAYTVRLNQSGEFNLPPSRVEALYNPDVYGEWPNLEPLKVHAK